MKKLLLLSSFLLMGVLILPAQGKKQASEKINLEGKLFLKPWSKSLQSYCAQGSEYYVLKRPGTKELVLENPRGLDFSVLNKQDVWVRGYLQERVIEAQEGSQHPSEMSQRPVETLPEFETKTKSKGKGKGKSKGKGKGKSKSKMKESPSPKKSGFVCTVFVVESIKVK